MKNKFTLILLGLLTAVAGLQAQTAEKLMDEAAAKFTRAGSVELAFTTTTDGGPVSGTLTMQKRAYTLDTPRMSVWYDGNTQWVYSPKSQEITVTTPGTEELLESNPFTLITNYKALYKLTKGAGRTVVLTPKTAGKGTLTKAVITFAADGWPGKIDAVFDNGAQLLVTINNVAAGKAKPLSAYRLEPDKYPSAELIDLR